ncbi:MAG: hypothetical protein ACW976_01480 [Candidatus Ranarchaeia archaeon]
MDRKDVIYIGTFIGLLLVSLWFTIGPDYFGPDTGTLGGYIGVLAFVVYGWYLYHKLTEKDQEKIDQLQVFLQRVPSEGDFSHPRTSLAEDQTKLVARLEQGHRLFIAQFVSSLLLAPVVAVWGFMFIFAAAPPLERFVLEMLMIGVPFATFLLLMTKQGQVYMVYFKAMSKYLKDTKAAVESGRGDVDITTYVNLLFTVIHPDRSKMEKEPKEAIDQIRDYTRYLKWMPVLEVVVFGAVLSTFGLMFLTLGIYLINELLIVAILWLTVFFISLMVVRYWIFFRWRRAIRRWLKVYAALIGWSEGLEQSFLKKTDQTNEEG